MNYLLGRLLLFLILTIAVSSCSTTSNKPDSSIRKDIAQAKELAASGNYLKAAQMYQGFAMKEKPPISDKLLLRAMDLYIKSKQYSKAQNVAVSVDQISLSARERVLYHLLYAKAEINLGHHRNALKELDQISPSLLARPEQQLYHILRVKTLDGLGKRFESIQERINLARYLDEGDEFEHNNRKISKTLSQMSPAMLRHERSSAPQTLRGWIDYTLITQETLSNSPEQVRYLQRWRDQYPGHPAIYSEISPVPGERPQQPLGSVSNVAVILPHSGPYTAASHAIKQGMLTAREEQSETTVPQIKFYDSTAGEISTIYQRILQEGADLVIGPLEKQMIQQLIDSNTLETPMLALNQIEGISQNNLFQLGLNPRDEIEQVAAVAWQAGHRRALVFVPKTTMGERTGRLFSEYWEALGGTTLEIESYASETKELSKSISTLLNLDESMSRRRRLQSHIGKLEFTPKPRFDADMLFILAKPTVARIIRPLLSFYRVNTLPVYATSKVYSGKQDPSQDRDLSGIVFCGDNSKFEEEIHQSREEIANQYQVAVRNIPLFNLGYDTYSMITELSVLQQDSTKRHEGKTGILWLDSDNNIRRQLICGEFKKGYVHATGPGPILKANNNFSLPLPGSKDQIEAFQQNRNDLFNQPGLKSSNQLPAY